MNVIIPIQSTKSANYPKTTQCVIFFLGGYGRLDLVPKIFDSISEMFTKIIKSILGKDKK